MTDKKITDAIKNDWTGNKNSIFTAIGASNHTDKERDVLNAAIMELRKSEFKQNLHKK